MWITIEVLLGLLIISGINGYDVEEKNIFPKLTSFVDVSENEVCKAQTKLYKEHLENLTLWAHEMWDASAKYPVGSLRGNFYQLGDWDECLTIDGPFRTQYCLATISANVPTPDPPRNPISLYYEPFESVLNKIYKTDEISVQSRDAVQMGLCIPAACSSTDLENSLNEYLSTTKFPLENENVTYSAKVSQEMCQTKTDQKNYDSWDITFCALSLIIVLLVISSTLYDYYRPDKKYDKPTFSNKIRLAFSARKNFLELPKADESNPALRILYGIKVFSMIMIITDHRFATILGGPIINFDYIEQVNLYAFVIFFWASVFNHIGSGPFWKLSVTAEVMECRDNWWTNILYISNYVNDNHMCMVHSWYLSCDFHYFIIGVIVAMVLNKNRRLGLSLIAFFFVLSLIIPFVLTIVYLLPALVHFYPPTLRNPRVAFQWSYTKTHTRGASYVVGMIAGYIYYRLKGSDKRLSVMVSHALTLGSVLVMFVCITTGAVFYDTYHEYNAIEAGAYASLHRVAWSIGTVGILFSASYGHATVLKTVLSWSPWIPLGKLVYGAYLIHMSVQFRSAGTTSTPNYFTYFDVISLAFGDIALAFI